MSHSDWYTLSVGVSCYFLLTVREGVNTAFLDLAQQRTIDRDGAGMLEG